MISSQRRRVIAPIAFIGIAGLALAGCAEGGTSDDSGSVEGQTVQIAGGITGVEADDLNASFEQFTADTGINVVYTGDKGFEGNIVTKVSGGSAPDIAIVPQPGLVKALVDTGSVKAAPEAVEANVDANWDPKWKTYGTIDDVFYAAPMLGNVKGYVWYSPAEFADKGYEIPTTLAELDDLANTIADEGDHKPWCASYASDAATGWPVTDWIEDYVLREQGPDYYDQWYKHEIPFNDPGVVEAFDAVGDILKNEDMVGDVTAGLSIPFGEGGLPILDGTCSLHHQASFYEGFWGDGVTVAPDGDVFAFLLPPVNADDPVAVTGGGEIVGAFSDEPAVQAFQAYLSSDTWANNRVKLGGVISANSGVDASLASSPLLEQSIEILQNPDSIIRFDASDLMPGAVGGNSFFKGIVDWIGGESSQSVADKIEAGWPTS